MSLLAIATMVQELAWLGCERPPLWSPTYQITPMPLWLQMKSSRPFHFTLGCRWAYRLI